jgi:hypothetical protein
MKLIELIKAALLKAGLPEDLHDQIKAETEDEVDAKVEEFKKTYVPPTKPNLAEMLKDETFKKDLEEYTQEALKSEVDRRVTQALDTYDKKMNPDKKEKESEAIVKLNEKIDKLTETLTGQQETQETQRLKGLATAALKEAGVPESWIDRVNVKSEDKIAGVVKTLQTEHTAIKQGVIDDVLKEHPIPGLALGTSGNITTGKIDEFAADLKKTDESVPVQKL